MFRVGKVSAAMRRAGLLVVADAFDGDARYMKYQYDCNVVVCGSQDKLHHAAILSFTVDASLQFLVHFQDYFHGLNKMINPFRSATKEIYIGDQLASVRLLRDLCGGESTNCQALHKRIPV